MPHQAVKIIPGVDTTRTVALNEAALSSTNLVRLVPDRQGLGIVQKLGGWTNYYSIPFSSTVRALKGWADLNSVNHLAVGSETNLNMLTSGNLKDITPLQYFTSVPADFSTTLGSSIVTVTDADIAASVLDYVIYLTPVSVGGLILQGPYKLITAASNTYSIDVGVLATSTQVTTTAINAGSFVVGRAYVIKTVGTTDFTLIGAPNNTIGTIFVATGVGAGTGTATVLSIPAFKTTINDSAVSVALNNHNFAVDQTFTIDPAVAVTVGGVTLSGTYVISSVISSNVFTIVATDLPSATSNYVAMNGNEVYSEFFIATGPQPTTTGYGVGGYGVGGYGTGSTQVPTQGTSITATDWSLDNFGQILIANPAGGGIYYYDPSGAIQTAQIVGSQSPLFNNGVFVSMPQRQLVAYGSSFGIDQDPLLIRWCDIEDFSVWIATSTNQAGSYRIPSGSAIVAGMQAYQQGLFWTDLDMWAMQYVGPPFVYGFNKIASNCGAIGRKSIGQFNNVVYWMSQKQFFRFSGAGAEPIPCPVWDVVFQNIKQGNDINGVAYAERIRCAVNTQFNEITWFYPSVNGNGENDSYVKYNVSLNQWDYGSLGRTAWIDQSVLGAPIGAGSDNYLYQHETSNSATSGTQTVPLVSTMRTGYFALSEADQLIFIDQIWPDMKWGTFSGAKDAIVNLTFYGTNYAGDTPTVYGPYPMTEATQYLSVRIRARLMSIEISSPTDPATANQFWRLGNIRYRYQADGRF